MCADRPFAPTIKRLAWDSNFFGFEVGSLSLDEAADPAGVRAALRSPDRVAYHLIVVSHPGGHDDLRRTMAGTGGRLVDVKYDYCSDTGPDPDWPEHVEEISAAMTPTDHHALHALALVSGQHSRFRVDPRISEDDWVRLYGLWVENSLSGAIADTILVHRIAAGRIAGFVTIKAHDGHARIGLIAVDPGCQGLGVGRQLIAATRSWAARRKLARIFVATQQDNIGACRFYARMGFSLATQTDIHHLWTTS